MHAGVHAVGMGQPGIRILNVKFYPSRTSYLNMTWLISIRDDIGTETQVTSHATEFHWRHNIQQVLFSMKHSLACCVMRF